MPTYEYKCDACGEEFEKFQSITSAPIRKCPGCGKNTARRLISSGAGLIFRGSGFYITDYRPESYKIAAKADSGGNGDGKKMDSKPQTTPAAKPSVTATESKTTAAVGK